MKVFLLTYGPLLVVALLAMAISICLLSASNPFLFLLGLLFFATAIFIIRKCLALEKKYEWACKKCGHESILVEGLCTECGGIMGIKEKQIGIKYINQGFKNR